MPAGGGARDYVELAQMSDDAEPALASDEFDEAAASSAVLIQSEPSPRGGMRGFIAKCRRYWSSYSIVRLVPSIVLLLSIWFIPPPDGLTVTSMHLLAVFVSVILSFLTQPFGMSTIVRP